GQGQKIGAFGNAVVARQGGDEGKVQPSVSKWDGGEREAAAYRERNQQRRRAHCQQRQQAMLTAGGGTEKAVPRLGTAHRKHSEHAPAQDGHNRRRQGETYG